MLQKSYAWYCRWVNKRFGLKPSEPDSIMQKELRVYLVRFPLVSWGTWLGFTRSGWKWPETLGCRKSRGFSPDQDGNDLVSPDQGGNGRRPHLTSSAPCSLPRLFLLLHFSFLFSLNPDKTCILCALRRVDLKSCKQNKIFCNFIHISVLNFLTHDIHLMILTWLLLGSDSPVLVWLSTSDLSAILSIWKEIIRRMSSKPSNCMSWQ